MTKVERENKLYVDDKVIIVDRDVITPSELLELAGFSSLVYDCYYEKSEGRVEGMRTKRKKKADRPLDGNNKINV